ncbi:uncharacterized protein LOC122645060 [Telopea speciosissima]|uniref:uncharacterized protein LOC122645060 n=1 Tax=Telopea speciosissima TaxID=54955 RepID=UPI001CC62328|nr:uncharacterized protein LOC122645060 [Telopea speciosissima]
MDSICNQENHNRIMVEGEEDDDLDSISFSSEISSNSISSSLSDFMDDATTATESSAGSSSSLDQLTSNGPLYQMSSLIKQLPFKRGLSRYYQGKSESFTSLSNVRSLEDLAKPENPFNKKLKTWRSYEGLSERSKIISKKTSRGFCYAANVRMRSNSFLGNNRPLNA